MNFGSEHVYLYDSSDEEYIPEEELSRGIELSLKWVDQSRTLIIDVVSALASTAGTA